MEIQKIFYTKLESAYVLGISVRSVEYLLANRLLAFRKIGRKTLIHHNELQRFARQDHPHIQKPTTASGACHE